MDLRTIDLNLLLPLHTLLEERHVTRAGRRVNLSQPAMSRSLQRLRELFADDFLIRTQGEYQLTARGNVLLQELELVLPVWSLFALPPRIDGDAAETAKPDPGTRYRGTGGNSGISILDGLASEAGDRSFA